VTTVRAARNPDLLLVDVAERSEILLRLHTIPQRLATMLAVVRREERFSVSTRTAIVDTENHVAVVREILRDHVVTDARLPAWTTMNQQQRRSLIRRTRILRLVKNRWNLDAIKRLVSNHGGVDEIRRVDLRIQAVG